mgnify:CR=1 FL=1|jgi:hypothetical protein
MPDLKAPTYKILRCACCMSDLKASTLAIQPKIIELKVLRTAKCFVNSPNGEQMRGNAGDLRAAGRTIAGGPQ